MNCISMSLKTLWALLLITSIWVVSPLTPLNAQNIEPRSPSKELIGPKLQPFVEAFKEVSQIHDEYKERILIADDPTQIETLQQEANQKMTQAVADHGLTIGDYNTIFQTIQNDPALKEEFMTVRHRTQ